MDRPVGAPAGYGDDAAYDVNTPLDQWAIAEGTDVIGADGDKVGEVVAVQPSYIVVEKGFFFPTDYYIPRTAINTFDGSKIYLSVTKEEALNQGWDVAPTDYGTDYAYTDTAAAAAPRTETTAFEETVPAAETAPLADTTATAGTAGVGAMGTAEVADQDVVRVPIHEEELVATKRPTQVGEVEIQKQVVSEQRTVEVPVTEERVRVQERVVDRDVAPGEQVFEEGVIEVPIRGEEVVAEKRARVAGEVEITKEQVQRTEQVTGTVRREEVHVDDTNVQGAVDAADTVGTEPVVNPDLAAGDLNRGV